MGLSAADLLGAVQQRRVVATRPAPAALGNIRVASVPEFAPEAWIPESKTIRMMSRDAQLAVAAATLAMRDAQLIAGKTYAPDQIGLFGATGLASIALDEVSRLVQASADPAGQLDLARFGSVALRQVRPVLSFKILANMPLCFVSIFLNIQGPNAIFSPWECQAAHAVDTAAQCIQHGLASAALVGGCDVKTHELGLVALRQQGALERNGLIVGEGAGFLVLEDEVHARARGARIYARLRRGQRCGNTPGTPGTESDPVRPLADGAVVATGTSPLNPVAQSRWGRRHLSPKDCIGDLFAAAAAIQIGLAAQWAAHDGGTILACCSGHGGRSMTFHLEPA